jgi:GT2 family glycosyltransferase
MYQATLDTLHRLDELLISDSTLADVFDTHVSGNTDWQAQPKHRTFLYFIFNLIDSLYNRFRAGIVDYETWLPWRGWVIQLVKNPYVTQFWNSVRQKHVYSRPFARFMDAYCHSDPGCDVGIVIPFRGSTSDLTSCLEALGKCSIPNSRILVVCDGYQRETVESIATRFSGSVSLAFIPASGPAAARNRGLYAIACSYVFFIDSDVLVPACALALMYEAIKSDDRIGGVQALPVARDPNNAVSRYEEYEYWLNYVHATEQCIDVGQLHSHCVVYRRDILLDIGGFDERFRCPGGEDTDVSFAVSNCGYRLCILSEARVCHRNAGTVREYVRRRLSRVRARARLYKKHPSRVLLDKAIGDSLASFVALTLSIAFLTPLPLGAWFLYKVIHHAYMLRKRNSGRSGIQVIVVAALMSFMRDGLYWAFPYCYLREVMRGGEGHADA